MSQTTNAVIAELMDRRLLNDVDDDLHQEIAEAVIQAARLSRPDTAEARLREALDLTRNALVVMRARLRTEPTVQGRGWVDLGIVVNDAIEEADKALSPPSGGDEAKESEGGEPTFGCKRAGGFVDTSCTAPCDCHVTQRLSRPSEPSPPADRREIVAPPPTRVDYRKFMEWVGLNGPRPTNAELAFYLEIELDNREEVDAVEAAVLREVIEVLAALDKNYKNTNKA